MGPEQFVRLLRHSLTITLLLGILIVMAKPLYGWSWTFGGLWSTANLWAWQELLAALLQGQNKSRIFWWAQIKLPLLYGIGALILWKFPLSVGVALFGFHVPFVLILVEAVYYQYRDSMRAPGTPFSGTRETPKE